MGAASLTSASGQFATEVAKHIDKKDVDAQCGVWIPHCPDTPVDIYSCSILGTVYPNNFRITFEQFNVLRETGVSLGCQLHSFPRVMMSYVSTVCTRFLSFDSCSTFQKQVKNTLCG